MNRILVQFIFTAVMGVVTQIHAGEVTTTHTFQSGTPASAAEVNQNFTDVKTAVDDNDSRITVNEGDISSNTSGISSNVAAIGAIRQGLSVYDNGQRIGALISATAVSGTPNYLTFLSDTGYIESYENVGLGTALLFSTTDCTGQAYYQFYGIAYSNGLVIKSSNSGIYEKVYSVPASSSASLTMESYLSSDACTAQTSTTTVIEVSPNDPAVTGIQNSFTGPITIGY